MAKPVDVAFHEMVGELANHRVKQLPQMMVHYSVYRALLRMDKEHRWKTDDQLDEVMSKMIEDRQLHPVFDEGEWTGMFMLGGTDGQEETEEAEEVT
jgi:hypothetical protein